MSESPSGSGFHVDALLRVLELTRHLSARAELGEVLEQVIEAGRAALHADRGAVFLYAPASRELRTKVATGEREIRISIDEGIAGACAREREVVNVPDCYADDRFNRQVDRRTGYRTRCVLALPLIGLEGQLVGVLQLLNSAKPRFDEADERIGQVLAAQAAVAIQRAVLIEDREAKLKLERDLDIARRIQQNVLPARMPDVPGYDLAAFNDPADQTGGDIFDVQLGPRPQDLPASLLSPDHAGEPGTRREPPGDDDSAARSGTPDEADGRSLYLVLADATGHGIGPALSVTQFLAMIRLGLRVSPRPDQIIAQANEQLCEDLPESRFITAFLGVLLPERHRVLYVAAGQGPLLHFHAATERFDWINATGLPLGIMPGAMKDPPASLELAPGDWFILLTDGFYEYADPQGELFGAERVAQIVREHRRSDAETMIDALVQAVRAFGDGEPQHDDLTAIALRRLP